ncbi:MAG: GTP-binding protein [Betaproteobacteria bacterium]
MSLLQTAQFLDTVVRLEHLPKDDLPEIAFVGRSNAGKSSAINVLCERKRLAFASKTPGRTQALNLFNLRLPASTMEREDNDVADTVVPRKLVRESSGRLSEAPRLTPVWIGRLVDTPGYGYAEAPIHTKSQWDRLAGSYLQARKNLRAVVLISDVRRGLTTLDQDLLRWVAPHIPVVMLLTKADKLTHQERLRAIKAMKAKIKAGELVRSEAMLHCLLFSATHRMGLDETRELIKVWLLGSAEAVQPEPA